MRRGRVYEPHRLSREAIEPVPGEAAPTGADTTPPDVGFYGSAVKAVEEGATTGSYELHIAATDGSPSSPQSGVAKIEVGVDGTTLQSWEKYCPVGSCPLEVTWPYQPGNFPGEGHVISVTIRDHAGNVTTRTIEPTEFPQPLAAWSFDEGSGTVAHDVTGNGHDGTLSAKGVVWVEGKYGGALKFDGKEGCVTVPDSPALRLHEGFTLEAWIRPDGELLHLPAVTKQAEGFPAYGLGVGMTTAGRAEGQIGTATRSHTDVASPSSVPANEWTHEAVTFDGTNLRLYLNGTLVATRAAALSAAGVAGLLEIGCSASGHFRGSIDEPRIYGRALTAEQIQATTHPMPGAETNPPNTVEATEAVLRGVVHPGGEVTEYEFEYGPTKSYGNSAPEVVEEPASGKGAQTVEEVIEGLQPGTTYHYRLVAWNKSGTTFGADQTLTTAVAAPLSITNQPAAPASGGGDQGFVNIGWSGDTKKTSESPMMEEIKGSGDKMLRFVVSAVNEESEKVFRLAAEREITILPDLSGIPNVPNNRIDLGIDPVTGEDHEAEWLKKITKIVSAFKPGGTFWVEHPALKAVEKYAPTWWEIWNEENYGTNGTPAGTVDPALYGHLLEISHNAITGIEPTAKILFGGLLTVKKKPGEVEHIPVARFIEDVQDGSDYDALSLHPYAFSGAPEKCKKGKQRNKCSHKPQTPNSNEDVEFLTHQVRKNVVAARAGLNHAGGQKKKIWVTELGWPVQGPKTPNDGTHLPVTEEMQRKLLNSTFNMIKKEAPGSGKGLGIENVFYYNIQDYIDESHTTWDYRAGLREEEGHGEGGRYREAWYAFQDQTGYEGKYP